MTKAQFHGTVDALMWEIYDFKIDADWSWNIKLAISLRISIFDLMFLLTKNERILRINHFCYRIRRNGL